MSQFTSGSYTETTWKGKKKKKKRETIHTPKQCTCAHFNVCTHKCAGYAHKNASILSDPQIKQKRIRAHSQWAPPSIMYHRERISTGILEKSPGLPPHGLSTAICLSVHCVCMCVWKVYAVLYACKSFKFRVWNWRKNFSGSHVEVNTASAVPIRTWQARFRLLKGPSGHFSDSYGAVKHLTSSVLAFCIRVRWMASIWNGFQRGMANRLSIHHTGVSLQSDI